MKYYFINNLETNNIDKQDKQTVIIYRNYSLKKLNENLLLVYTGIKRTAHYIAKTFIHIDIISSEELPHRPNCWLY